MGVFCGGIAARECQACRLVGLVGPDGANESLHF